MLLDLRIDISDMAETHVYKRYGYPPPLQGRGIWRYHHQEVLAGTPVGHQAPNQQRVFVNPCTRMTTKDPPALMLSRPHMRNYFVQIPKDIYPGEVVQVALDADVVLLRCPLIKQPFETVIVTIVGELAVPVLPGDGINQETAMAAAAAVAAAAVPAVVQTSGQAVSAADGSAALLNSSMAAMAINPTDSTASYNNGASAPITNLYSSAAAMAPLPAPPAPTAPSAPSAPQLAAPVPAIASPPPAPAPAPTPGGPACPACTYINSPGARRCELCETQIYGSAAQEQQQQQQLYGSPATVPQYHQQPQQQPQQQQYASVQPAAMPAPVTQHVQLVIPPHAQPGGIITFRTPKGNMVRLLLLATLLHTLPRMIHACVCACVFLHLFCAAASASAVLVVLICSLFLCVTPAARSLRSLYHTA